MNSNVRQIRGVVSETWNRREVKSVCVKAKYLDIPRGFSGKFTNSQE